MYFTEVDSAMSRQWEMVKHGGWITNDADYCPFGGDESENMFVNSLFFLKWTKCSHWWWCLLWWWYELSTTNRIQRLINVSSKTLWFFGNLSCGSQLDSHHTHTGRHVDSQYVFVISITIISRTRRWPPPPQPAEVIVVISIHASLLSLPGVLFFCQVDTGH